MGRNAKSITTSPEIVRHIEGLTEANFNLLTKLVPWLDANEQAERRFRNAVIGSLTRMEAAISMVLVAQQAEQQGKRPFYCKKKLEEDAKAAEEFIEKQSLERGVNWVKYIYQPTKETPVDGPRHDRRRKWTGWEI
jgi:hypothetical protein